MEEYIYKDNKKLRYGYTTGSCAAAASKACCHDAFNKIRQKYFPYDTERDRS